MKRRVKDALPVIIGVLLALCISFLHDVHAQDYTNEVGTLAFLDNNRIQIDMVHRSTTIDRDIMSNIPLEGEYQNLLDDLALLDLFFRKGGVEIEVPPIRNDSLIAALDSLIVLSNSMQDELQQKDQAITERDSVIAELEAENNYALRVVREANRALRNR